MKTQQQRLLSSVIAAAVLAISAGQALAADPVQGKTREQVKAELAEALRTGDIVVGGESGRKANELFPERYAAPAKAVVKEGKTREQVKAELNEALRNGDVVAGGESGRTLRELFPGRYAQPSVQVQAAQGKTRAQVKAELAEAIRTGDIIVGGDSGRTAKELFPNAYEVEPADRALARQPHGDEQGSKIGG
jgi:ribosomal protein L30E